MQCGIHRPCLTLPRAFKALRVTLKVALAFFCLVLLVVWLLVLFVVSVCLATLLVLALNSTKVTCAKPAHTAPPLVQKKGIFFPRVRTPCGHGAQVIVEGREEQSDGGEKNKDNQNNPKPNKPQPTGRVSTIMKSFLCAR